METIKKVYNIWCNFPQFIRFIIVGGYNTVFGWLVFSLFYYLWGNNLHYAIILIFAFIVGILNNFILFKIFVFKTKGNWLQEGVSTYISYAFLYPVNYLILFITINMYGMSAYMGQGIAVIIMPIITYFVLKIFAFKKRDTNTDK
ncbi:MAG: GtrA family protein [Alphaproteobacteria bacterium]|jgi:putative flippase GtrA|nr:GtrA family protein [Alphaproteobacteria bacterium]